MAKQFRALVALEEDLGSFPAPAWRLTTIPNSDTGVIVLKKETEDSRRWKDHLCSLISKTDIVKMPVLPKVIYRENQCNDYKSSNDILNRVQEKKS